MKFLLVGIFLLVAGSVIALVHDSKEYDKRKVWVKECVDSGGVVMPPIRVGLMEEQTQCVWNK